MKATRLVSIDLLRNTYFVRYVERAKGTRHTAAQFYARDHTLESVETWVRENPKLRLSHGEPVARTVKSVSYFYPTSTNAKRFKMPEGGYSVSLTDFIPGKDCVTTEAESGYATKDAAMKAADKLPHEWASWMANDLAARLA
jgi:hypothetical protein